jgi:pectate lyase
MKRKKLLAFPIIALALASCQVRPDASLVSASVSSSAGNSLSSLSSSSEDTASVGPSNETSSVSVSSVVSSSASSSQEAPAGIKEEGGLLEAAFMSFNPISGAEGYQGFVKAEDSNEWTGLDNQLIRNYGSYYRVDALGLKAGHYRLKIAPVIGGQVKEEMALVSNVLDAKGHLRAGFGFKGGDASGAYNSDGTLKADTKVIYITKDNINTVSANILTSAAKNKYTTCTGLDEIIYSGLKKGQETSPYDFRIIGTIEAASFIQSKSGKTNMLYFDNGMNGKGVTIEGVGNDATFYGVQALIKDSNNVEMRNLGFMLSQSDEKDEIGIEQDNKHIWVHNNDIFYGMPGSDSDQKKGDGSCDLKQTDYATVSFNHFFDSGKACLLESSVKAGVNNHVTYHHNWFDHSDSRHPRIRQDTVHVFNNYYDGNAKYGIGSTSGSSVFAEANYFRNCKYPMLTSMQGSDIASNPEGTFSKEDGGTIKAYGNFIEGGTLKPYSSANNVEFDCYEVSSRAESVPSTVVSKKGGFSYSNFDLDSSTSDEADTIDAVQDVPAIVTGYAGRQQGGDFKWVFDNSTQDANDVLIPELKKALLDYKTSLVSVGGIN